MSRFLITGGSGFIGSHLAEMLLSSGHDLIVYDDFSTGSRSNLQEMVDNSPDRIVLLEGDIRDPGSMASALKGVDGIFHLAALVSVPQSIENPALSFDVNLKGTQVVLNEARKAKIHRVVMASSAAVYGNPRTVPSREEEVLDPISPYGLEKQVGEQFAKLFADLYGMNITCLRFFNVFGPRQPPHSSYSGVVSIFAKNAASGHGAKIFGVGDQVRDFVWVGDVAGALVASMNSTRLGYSVYNVGSGRGTTILELWRMIKQISGCRAEAYILPARPGDIANSIADVAKIENELGFRPSSVFEEHLAITYAWSKREGGA